MRDRGMSNIRRAVRLCVAALAAVTVWVTGMGIWRMPGGVDAQLRLTNILLAAMPLGLGFVRLWRRSGRIGSNSAAVRERPPAAERVRDKRETSFFDAEKDTLPFIHDDETESRFSKTYKEIMAEREEKRSGQTEGPEDKTEVSEEAQTTPAEDAAYAEIVNRGDIVFNATPIFRLAESKSTFVIGRREGRYALSLSDGWEGSGVTANALKGELLRYVFDLRDEPRGDIRRITHVAPALVSPESAEGRFRLERKGVITFER